MFRKTSLSLLALLLPSTEAFHVAPNLIAKTSRLRLTTPTTLTVGSARRFSSSPTLFASVSLPPDYEDRSKANDFDSPSDILKALESPDTIVLDVRSADEIAQGKFETKDPAQWKTTQCSPQECPGLVNGGCEEFIPSKDTTVVIYCGSGIRANRAKQTLMEQGYTNVLNAGGLKDLLAY